MVMVMKVPINEELRRVARSIIQENKSLDEWAEVESDDMFQEGNYSGGFDADEAEFCFSYFGPDGEIWFQMSLAQIEELASGGSPVI
jgi:hypothetical protein